MSNLSKKCIISGDIFITETILTGLQQSDNITEYIVADSNQNRRDELSKKYKLNVVSDPIEFANDAKFIILAFKAEDAKDIFAKLENKVNKSTLIVSVIGTIAMKFIQDFFPDNQVMRLTLNPSIISGEGIGAYMIGSKINSDAEITAQSLIEKFGNISKIDNETEFENIRNFILANTFFSYIVVKSMIEAAEKKGFSLQQAGLIIDQILKGASRTLIKFQIEGSEMIKEGFRNNNVTNHAIELIKDYGIYDSMERYLTTKEFQSLFFANSDNYDNDMDNLWSKNFVKLGR